MAYVENKEIKKTIDLDFETESLISSYKTFNKIAKENIYTNINQTDLFQAYKMLDIKKTQLGYKSVYGKYADSFDELVKFVETQKFDIISRRDTAVIDAAKNAAFGIKVGADGVGGFFKDEVIITKLGTVKVKDSLFKNSDRYKRLNVVKVGDVEVPVVMKTGVVSRNDMNLSVFQAIIDKNALLKDLDQELVKQENKVESIDEINGPQIILGSLEEVTLTGNWPKKYGNNE